MKYYTHAGLFHCDEVMGWVICKLAGVCNELVRLDDITNIPDDGVVADIGREYDPGRKRFDHHQGFLKRANGYPYASAGLLWKEYGAKAVIGVIGECDLIDKIVERVDKILIQGIDAHDSDNEYSVFANCIAGKVSVFSLSNIIKTFNYRDVKHSDYQTVNFISAGYLLRHVLADVIIQANNFFVNFNRFDSIAEIDGEVATLTEWIDSKEIVHEKYPFLKFIITPSNHPGSPWSMTAVPKVPDGREVKVPIERPEWFKGFIHQGKWIAGSDSVDELKKLASYSIANYKFKSVSGLG